MSQRSFEPMSSCLFMGRLVHKVKIAPYRIPRPTSKLPGLIFPDHPSRNQVQPSRYALAQSLKRRFSKGSGSRRPDVRDLICHHQPQA